jgi:hypothetical protein
MKYPSGETQFVQQMGFMRSLDSQHVNDPMLFTTDMESIE